jgi:hypothetical protein
MQFSCELTMLRVLPLLALLAAWSGGYCQAQENRSQRFRFDAGAGLIINRAFSNITEKEERPDESSLILRTPSDSASNVKTGFFIGVDMILGRQEGLNGLFGISFARSGAEYHYSYLEELATSRPGFTKRVRNTEHDILETYNALNVHAGLRNRLAEGFFLSASFVFSNPLSITRITNGYTSTVFTTNGPDTETFMEYVDDEKKVEKRGQSNLSFRLNAEYQFSMAGSLARVFIFRNFGLVYTLPWWGLGLSYTVR